MALPMAAMVFGCAPLDQMFQRLEALNPNRIPVMVGSDKEYSSSSSSTKNNAITEDNQRAEENKPSRSLVMKVQTDESTPAPCFVYREPGTKGEIICTRLPWMDVGQ